MNQTASRSDKWITGLHGGTPMVDAALHVLKLRLSKVSELVGQWVKRTGNSPTHVHQLRVATRRAAAALDVFGECLDGAQREKMRKMLRRVRRAAGQVRMADVHMEMLRRRLANESGSPQIALEHALARTAIDRQQTCRELDAAIERCGRRGGGASGGGGRGAKAFLKRTKRLLQSIDEPKRSATHSAHRAMLSDLATNSLQRLAAKFHEISREDLSAQEALHNLRIRGKQLRYVIEIFGSCLNEPIRDELYQQLSNLQEKLGAINDCHELAQRLQSYSDEVRDALHTTDTPRNSSNGQAAEEDQNSLVYRLANIAADSSQQCGSHHQQFLIHWHEEHSEKFMALLDELAGLAGTSSDIEDCDDDGDADDSSVTSDTLTTAIEVIVVEQRVHMPAHASDEEPC